jgi:hypothetical protein
VPADIEEVEAAAEPPAEPPAELPDGWVIHETVTAAPGEVLFRARKPPGHPKAWRSTRDEAVADANKAEGRGE